MKKILVALLLILLAFSMITCSKNQILTTDDLIKFIEEKGEDNLDWKDLEHLKHEQVGFGIILEKYYLSDGNYLLLSGTPYETKPEEITLCDSEDKVIKEIK